MSPAAYSGVMTGTREHDAGVTSGVTSCAVRRPLLGSASSRQNTVDTNADPHTPRSDDVSRDEQPLFRRRRQLFTPLDYDRRLPGYMKPTFGSSQKALLNRSRTFSAVSVSNSRPQSSPALTLSSSLNLQRSMRIADKSINSTSSIGYRAQPQTASARHHLIQQHRAVQHANSVPITSGQSELQPTSSFTAAGRSALMRPDSRLSRDASDSPRSGDVRRRQRRIDLGLLPHGPSTSQRVTAAGVLGRDSPLSAAGADTAAPRTTQSPALARCSTDANVHERLGSGNVTERVVWSHHDSSDAPSPTVGRAGGGDSVDCPSPSFRRHHDENGARDSPLTRHSASGGGGPSQRSQRPTTAGQPLSTHQQQRPPPTRPSTTSRCVAVKATSALTTPKSVSQPTFLAMLVSGTAVTSPAVRSRGDHVVVDRTPNSRLGGGGNNNNIGESTSNSEEPNNNDDDDNYVVDDEEDDEEDEMKRRRIENWLQDLETVVLDRPASPTIDEDVPPQTDTAIHIVYDGD